MKDGLRHGCLFQIDISVNQLRDLGEFIHRLQTYISYEEDALADRVVSKPTPEKDTQ